MSTRRRKLFFGSLLILIALAVVGLYLTSGPEQGPAASKRAKARNAPQAPLVDSQPLDTARQLLMLADTPGEADLAREALRLGDHAVDLAFASALREAHDHPATESEEVKKLHDRINRIQSRIQAGQDNIKQLNERIAHPSRNEKENLQEELDLAQARLSLQQDRLDDAKQDLIRSGGDRESQIQAMLDQHESQQNASKEADANLSTAKQPFQVPGTLAAQLSLWRGLKSGQQAVLNAQAKADSAAQALRRKHDELEQSVQAKSADGVAAPPAAGSPGASGAGTEQPAQALAQLRTMSNDQKRLAGYDRRIDTQQQLAQVYGDWAGLIAGQRQLALHAMIRSALLILITLLAVLAAESLIVRFLPRAGPDRRRFATMRMMLQFAVRGVGLLTVLIVLLGPPGQLSTVLALAGAGLTVALKDFIVAFFGWFVLIGRNGIRVGDWVEIDGISGEVVEIGLLRTSLLESGNWNDSGHPTGRKVAFVNSFAIEGHYFNFSTSGQWLWDELDVQLSPGDDPYQVSEAIQKIVATETQGNAALAEKEWQRATPSYHVRSVAPAINVRPTSAGLKILVRYITTAASRQQMRDRLYEAIVELLHHRTQKGAAEEAGAPRP